MEAECFGARRRSERRISANFQRKAVSEVPFRHQENMEIAPERTIVSERQWGEFTEVVWSDGAVTLHRPTDESTTIRFSADRANH